MIRTQIYLPDEVHEELTVMARSGGTTLAELIRQSAKELIQRKYDKQKSSLAFFSNPPKEFRSTKTGTQLVNKLREDRDAT